MTMTLFLLIGSPAKINGVHFLHIVLAHIDGPQERLHHSLDLVRVDPGLALEQHGHSSALSGEDEALVLAAVEDEHAQVRQLPPEHLHLLVSEEQFGGVLEIHGDRLEFGLAHLVAGCDVPLVNGCFLVVPVVVILPRQSVLAALIGE